MALYDENMNTAATQTDSSPRIDFVAIEDMQLGRRYMTCRPGYEADWTVERITRTRCGDRVSVIVTYANGIKVRDYEGTQVAVFCDELGASA